MTSKKSSLIVLFITHSFLSFAQMTIDTVKHTVCHGKDITLNATNGQFYKWDNGSIANSQTVSTLTNKSVEVLVYDTPEGNLVQNGNFDMGNTLFTSEYTFYPNKTVLYEGFYDITPDASKVHYGFRGFGKTDLAKAGTDNFMAVNGSSTPNLTVWQQTITVEPNTLYAFSCLTTNLVSFGPARLQFSIDGVQLGNIFSTNMYTEWDQFYQTWTSGSQTSITIRILNQNTSGGGNDFALDDIYFAKIVARKEVHKINVFKPAVDLGINKSFCAAGTLDAGSGFDSYEWNTGATSQSIQVNTGGNYNVKVSKDGCEATSSVLVAINPLPVVGAISNISAICEGDIRVLSIANSKPTSTYTWKVSGAVPSPTTGFGQTFSITAGTAKIDVEVLEKDVKGCNSSSARMASISVDKKPTAAVVSNSVACADAIIKTTGNQPVIGQGKWVVDVLNSTSGYSIDNLTNYNSNVTKPSVVSYGDKLTAVWEIRNGVCPVSKQTMVLNFQPLSNRLFTLSTDNTQICEGNNVVLTAKIDGFQVGNMPVYKLFDGMGNLVPSTPVLKDTTQALFTLQNVTSNLNGYYVERTSNSIPCLASSLINTTPRSVKVDKKPTKANIIEDKLVVCSTEKEINFDQINIGTAAWAVKKGNQGSVAGNSTTKAKISGLVVDQSSTFYLTSSNGICPATKDSVLITRTGNPTIPTVKSQNDSICETAVAPKLIGTPINPSAIATETGTWSSIGTAQIDNTGQTKDLVFGENKFVYTISNRVCQPDLTDTVTITVIKAPLAEILLPIDVKSTDNPSIKSISNLNQSIWISASQSLGYSGKWSVTNGATAIGLKGENVSVLADSLLLKNFNDKTTATWTVQDEGKKCNEAKATIEVIRKNYTSAFAGKDTSVCISAIPFNWSGNDFSATDEIATWSLVSSNPAGATVTQIGTSKNALFNASEAGVYEFEYKIQNTSLGITTQDTIKLTVDAKPVAPTLTLPSPINTCLDKLNLPAKHAEPILTAIGTWKFDKSQPITTQTIGTPNNANSLLENIPLSSVTKLFWVVQNGVCKKDSIALVVNQIGTMTPATIRLNGAEIKGSDTSLCLSAIHSLEGSTPSSDPIKGETNVWNNTGTSVSISGGTNTNQPLTLNAVGESQISYTIKNDDPNCIASVKTIKIKVNDIPVLDQITGVPNLCEDKSDSYSVSLKTGLGINTEPISAYTWNAISGATTGSATLLGSGTGSSATFSFQSTRNTGNTDTVSIKVFAQNACGNSLPLTKKIAIDLKPRDFIGDISGSDNVCESTIANEKYTILPQANTTSYAWTLANNTFEGTQPILETSVPTTALVALKPASTLKVTLSNSCGAGVEKTKSIAITPAVQIDAKITGQNSVCLPTDNILYQGSSTNAGTNAIYVFEIIHLNNSIGKTQTSSNPDFATFKGDLEDGDKIKLTIIGDATLGCFSSTGTDELLIDGYEYPDGTITVSKDSICEGDGAITLSINSTFNQNNKKNDNSNIKWYFVKNNSDSLLTNLNGLYSFSISKPNESGTYKVKVPGSVCIHDSNAEQVVKIYEKPLIRVLQDPMEVIYQDGIIVPMPVAITGLKNDTISEVAWTPDTWLSAANKHDAKFVPKKEKKEIDYTLTVSTGNGSITCETQANVKVINTLPLIIPNAFSPNGDGVNDVWEIQGLTKYKSVTITVFNRWGNTVFASKGQYSPWDGTINGIPMSVATYYAIIELKESLDNTDQTITQTLTIVR